ncbi:MAG: hypothetical protein K0R75_1525 [Paenibacillaceae bacterium]|jgi:cyclic lactone autoinducer peptide|nr:hypothetical protein [Paenibacillaceae bacterium]
MKKQIAIYLNVVLMAVGSFLVFTNSYLVHRPETPQELLKK